MLFIRCHPYVADGDLAAWLDYLQKIEDLELKIAVPGHGPVGSHEDIRLLRKYLVTLETTVKQIVEGKVPLEQLTQQLIPADFAGWRFSDFYSQNISSLFEHLNAPEEL